MRELQKLESLRGGPQLEKVRLRHVFHDAVDGEGSIVAVVWVPKEKRGVYGKKLRQYLQEETESGKPRNNDLVACIEDIRTSPGRLLAEA